MTMFKNAINTFIFRLSQFSPPKISENLGLLPSRFLPGVEALMTSATPHAEAGRQRGLNLRLPVASSMILNEAAGVFSGKFEFGKA